MYSGRRRSGGGTGGGRSSASASHPSAASVHDKALPRTGTETNGAVFSIRLQAKDALAELERSASKGLGASGGSRVPRDGLVASELQVRCGGMHWRLGQPVGGACVCVAQAHPSCPVPVDVFVSLTAWPWEGLVAPKFKEGLPTPHTRSLSPPGLPTPLAQSLSASSSSTNLFLHMSSGSLGDEGAGGSDPEENDPMSPQSVFPRVRQKLREEAADHFGASTALELPQLTTGTQTKKRITCGRQLPEIPFIIRSRTPPLLGAVARHGHSGSSSGSHSSSSGSGDAYHHHHHSNGASMSHDHLPQLSASHDDAASVSSSASSSSGSGFPRSTSCPPPSLPAFHKTAPAAVGHASSSTCSSSTSTPSNSSSASSVASLVITPLPRSAIQKSGLYEMQAALEELAKALADMELTAAKRTRVRSEAYIIKFETEYADLVRVKDRAVKRLEALLRGSTFAPESAHAQVLARVLIVVIDIDDELLMLMGEEHGTWEELKRLRGEIQGHLELLAKELGPEGGCEDPLGPAKLMRSMSSPTGGSLMSRCCDKKHRLQQPYHKTNPSPPHHCGGASAMLGSSTGSTESTSSVASSSSRRLEHSSNSGFNVVPASHGKGKEEAAGGCFHPAADDMFKLRPLEISLSAATASSASAALHHSSGVDKDRGCAHHHHHHAHEPESPSGTVTTASLSSSSSSAFSNASEQSHAHSDEEKSTGSSSSSRRSSSGSKGGVSKPGAAAAASAARLKRAVSSDGLSDLLPQHPPLPVALTKNIKEKASFIHHKTLCCRPLFEGPSVGKAGARASYHRRIVRPAAAGSGGASSLSALASLANN